MTIKGEGSNNPVARKQYQSPQLQCLGKITELTTGGSGMSQEMAPSMGMVDNNPNKFP